MEFADYPKHLRKQWGDIKESWNIANDRRGSRRTTARDEVRDWMMGKLHGWEIHNERAQQRFDERLLAMELAIERQNKKIMELKAWKAKSLGYKGMISLYKDVPEPFDLADKPVGAKFEQSTE